MDVVGNNVDRLGNSYDAAGNLIDLSQYFLDMNDEIEVEQKLKTYTRTLGKNIIASYRINNCVLTSSLLAFTAFQLFRIKYAAYLMNDFLKLSHTGITY